MARVIGYVKSFENGTFFVKDLKGKVHQLKAGEAIHNGELVYGAPNNSKDAKVIIDVTLNGAGDMVISGNGALVFDTSLLKGVFSHDDAVVYVNSVKDALAVKNLAKTEAETADKTAAGDETAAGVEVAVSEKSADPFYERTGAFGDVFDKFDKYISYKWDSFFTAFGFKYLHAITTCAIGTDSCSCFGQWPWQ